MQAGAADVVTRLAGMATAETDLVALLLARGETVATAESLTGGRLAALVTAVPGSSGCFVGGVVAYATRIKVEVLGVPSAVIEEYGAVSSQTAEAMARGVCDLLGSTHGLATTGVAGPDRQEGHPPGHVWVGCAGPDGIVTRLLSLSGDREAIQAESCRSALSMLAGTLRGEDPPLG